MRSNLKTERPPAAHVVCDRRTQPHTHAPRRKQHSEQALDCKTIDANATLSWSNARAPRHTHTRTRHKIGRLSKFVSRTRTRRVQATNTRKGKSIQDAVQARQRPGVLPHRLAEHAPLDHTQLHSHARSERAPPPTHTHRACTEHRMCAQHTA